MVGDSLLGFSIHDILSILALDAPQLKLSTLTALE